MENASLSLLLVALCAAPAVAAEPLPLKHGQYVMTDTPCRDAPFAAIMTYDGRGLGDPHDSRCVSSVAGRSADTYRIATTCSAAGDGSPVPPTTVRQSITLHASDRFAVGGGADATEYRWCGPAR